MQVDDNPMNLSSVAANRSARSLVSGLSVSIRTGTSQLRSAPSDFQKVFLETVALANAKVSILKPIILTLICLYLVRKLTQRTHLKWTISVVWETSKHSSTIRRMIRSGSGRARLSTQELKSMATESIMCTTRLTACGMACSGTQVGTWEISKSFKRRMTKRPA